MSTDIFECIQEQTYKMQPADIEEILLDKSTIEKISEKLKTTLETFQNLTSLSLNDCQLRSLENFPDLPNLIRLELNGNQLTGEDLKYILKLKELQSLTLSSNKINTIEEVKVLKELPKLFQLDFMGCSVALLPEYREKIFEELTQLGILDNHNAEGASIQYDDEEEDDEDEDNLDSFDYDSDENAVLPNGDDSDSFDEGADDDDGNDNGDEDDDEDDEEFDEEDEEDEDDADAIEAKSTQKKKLKKE